MSSGREKKKHSPNDKERDSKKKMLKNVKIKEHFL
jgi:hypothetical protein